MKFGIMFTNTGHGSSPEGAIAVATAAEDHDRDPDSIEMIANAGAPLGPKLDARIEQLAEIGVTHAIVPTFRPDALAEIGKSLNASYGAA